MSDAAIIRNLQKQISLFDDMNAYGKLYEMLFPPLHRFATSMIKSGEAAEEIVSDVFIKLWQMRNSLTDINDLKVYCYTITKNFSLNYITKHYKNPVVRLEELNIEASISIPTPEDLCISSDTVRAIRDAIQSLPPQCRLIFQLVKEDGLQYKEVAGILNISVLTVRNQLAIAMKKIVGLLPPSLTPTNRFPNHFSAS